MTLTTRRNSIGKYRSDFPLYKAQAHVFTTALIRGLYMDSRVGIIKASSAESANISHCIVFALCRDCNVVALIFS